MLRSIYTYPVNAASSSRIIDGPLENETFASSPSGTWPPDGVAIKNLPKLIEIVPEVRGVANLDWIAFAALHVLGDVVTADPGRDDALNIAYSQAVSRRFRSIHFDIDVETLRHTFGEDRPHFRQRAQICCIWPPSLLDALEVRPLDLMPTGVLIPVNSMSRRFSTGIVQVFESPGKCSFSSIA